MQEKDLLILGAGWTSTFLIPLLKSRNLTYAATTTTGRDDTIKFKFDPSLSYDEQIVVFSALPVAKTVLITFPLTGTGQSKLLLETYNTTHKRASARFVQLGSTGIWQIAQDDIWITRHSPYDNSKPRAVAEDELLSLGGCVLNLAGLWGGTRQPRDWVDRVAPTKDKVREKTSLHMIHGQDVSRAVVAVHDDFELGKGQRWMLTDGFVYDWWALFAGWGEADGKGSSGAVDAGGEDEKQTRQCKWVYELLQEEDVRALPRSMTALGRCYDSREFWQTFHIAPLKARI